jgi:aryl-alcohol dehydrogenase-like predicted oxidoreductase
METRLLGKSGLKVSVLSFGTLTFGGGDDFFQQFGATPLEEATRLIDICLDAGVNLFDTADVYSHGRSEEILGQALGNRRQNVLIATKGFARMGDGSNDVGLSRYHLIRACEASLRRLGTDYIDLYQVHNFDALTPLEETLRSLDDLVRSGKIRYIGCSNYAGWHLMKALGISKRQGWERYVSQQIHYNLIAREAEYELMPLGLDQGVGILVWSPLASGFLSGKYRRGESEPKGTRRDTLGDLGGTFNLEQGYNIVETLHQIASDRSVTVAQVALNWLLNKPGISSVVIGARSEKQLLDNLGTAQWQLTPDEIKQLDAISTVPEIYPYWQQHLYGAERNPPIQP